MRNHQESLRLAAWQLLQDYIDLVRDRDGDPEVYEVVRAMRRELGDTSDVEEAAARAEFMRELELLEAKHGFKLRPENGGVLDAVKIEGPAKPKKS